MGKSSKQSAGDHSVQLNINSITFSGLSREDVVALIRLEAKEVLSKAGSVARRVTERRLNEFEKTLVPRLVESRSLQAFEDPAMHILLREAQESAICTDEHNAYQNLTELLIYRANHRNTPNVAAPIKKAIEEVSNISTEALDALTIVFSVMVYYPVTGDIHLGFKHVDDLYESLLTQALLPTENDWLDNLEIINAVRVSPFGHRPRFADVMKDCFSGYSALGIKKETEDHEKANSILKTNNIPQAIMVENVFNSNYVRLNLPKKEHIDQEAVASALPSRGVVLNTQQTEALLEICNLYEESGTEFDRVQHEFINSWSCFQHIKEIGDWWDEHIVPCPIFVITSLGKILAHTNAKRINPSLPNLYN